MGRRWLVGWTTRDRSRIREIPSPCDTLLNWGSDVLIGTGSGQLLRMGVQGSPKVWLKLPLEQDECLIESFWFPDKTIGVVSDHGVWHITTKGAVKKVATYQPSCYYAATLGHMGEIVVGVLEGRMKRIGV